MAAMSGAWLAVSEGEGMRAQHNKHTVALPCAGHTLNSLITDKLGIAQ